MTHDLFNQQEALWTNSVHAREKSVYGQAHLDKNRKKFGGQNKIVFEYLMIPGNELHDEMVREWQPPIWHLHSRVSDLTSVKKFGFYIQRNPHPTKNLTVYYMTEEDRIYNRKLLKQFNQIVNS